jgi:hypothetical protein
VSRLLLYLLALPVIANPNESFDFNPAQLTVLGIGAGLVATWALLGMPLR